MKYKILNEDENLNLIERLLKIRGISEDADIFLNPKIKDYRLDPMKLNDMSKAVDRIILALKNNEKIMIFGDYDVDGITSSFILFKFFTKFLKYRNISIMYPDRIEEGYGIKNLHLDEIKKKGVSLVITVDNGITNIQEAEYAKKIGLDMIITDHHKNLEKIPDAIAVINPLISVNYNFKYLAGVGVAFKLLCALLDNTKNRSEKKKNDIFNYFLPIVAIGTVADIVSLTGENRLLVKKGLDLINKHRDQIPESLQGFLEYLNLKEVDTFHIGFVIGPRINAGGRIDSPYNSLNTLLFTGNKQLEALQKIDEINNDRKKLQEDAFKIAEEMLDLDQKILIAEHEDFHEGVVGIVSGKITEKYNKPSIVFKINKDKGIAVASLRGPEYFNIIEMLQKHSDLLERSGGHKQAGGLTILLDNLDEFKQNVEKYCNEIISDDDLGKILYIDTKIYSDEWNYQLIQGLENLAPFGEGNKEPQFLFENITVEKVEKVGKNGNGHMKIYGIFGDKKINFLFRGKGDMIKKINVDSKINIIGKIKKDDFNGGHYVNGTEIIE
ncbi:MAG: single-stranded-DNA-specific exonuclease RecJ [Candidatus Absconditabacterales bacterium]|nr:single-stranded-DNA-specific exonuclease RecJ [Candidatus Absconditabacterales bacterium]